MTKFCPMKGATALGSSFTTRTQKSHQFFLTTKKHYFICRNIFFFFMGSYKMVLTLFLFNVRTSKSKYISFVNNNISMFPKSLSLIMIFSGSWALLEPELGTSRQHKSPSTNHKNEYVFNHTFFYSITS